jgi:type IV secretion system protein VirB10
MKRIVLLLYAISLAPRILAQEPGQPAAPLQSGAVIPPTVDAARPSASGQKIMLPSGTRLPLRLSNGISTRTAKAGNSIYFETIYPIAQDGRIVIPMGSFVRGHLVEVRRPGRVKGRGEILVGLDSLTLPNGYVVALNATPNSADTGGKETVDPEGKIKGSSGVGHDVQTVLVTTAGGAYLGTNVALFTAGSLGKGAAVGGAAGAVAGLAVLLLTRGPEAELPRGTILDVLFNRSLAFDADRLPPNAPGRSSPLPEPALRSKAGPQQDRTTRRPQPLSLLPLLPF